MQLETSFPVRKTRDQVAETLLRDETLLGLLPGKSELVTKTSDRTTTRTHYSALGRDRTAVFHFDFMPDGEIHFHKECDGVMWRKLRGELTFYEQRGQVWIRLALEGTTKPLVPEFALKSPMEEQLLQMAEALRAVL